MGRTSIDIRHGKFEDVVAHPRQFDGVTIVPAVVKLTGPSPLTNGSCLEEYLRSHDLAPDTLSAKLVQPAGLRPRSRTSRHYGQEAQ